MSTPETPFGKAIKQARGRTSIRAAADRAGISEGRWRQLELGYQQAGGHKIPARPKVETARVMAEAVGLDVTEALALAGFDAEALPPGPSAAGPPLDLFAAIDAEPRLLPEAKQHLKMQVGLLLRVQAIDPGALLESDAETVEEEAFDIGLVADLRKERKTQEGRPSGGTNRQSSRIRSTETPQSSGP